jgi:hypothetical protein
MAAGLSDHVWTMEELLRYRVLPLTGAPAPRQPDEVGRAARRGRVKAPPAEAVA